MALEVYQLILLITIISGLRCLLFFLEYHVKTEGSRCKPVEIRERDILNILEQKYLDLPLILLKCLPAVLSDHLLVTHYELSPLPVVCPLFVTFRKSQISDVMVL